MPARKFRSEGPILYDRYQFGYCEWAELDEAGETEGLGGFYGDGYLPYSANPQDPRHLFYMARSLRVPLDRLAMDKKRRYNHREWENHGLQRKLFSKSEFVEQFGDRTADLAQSWMKARFGKAYLGTERYAHIFAKPFLKDVLTWTKNGQLVAFALIVRGGWGAHYWYVFYQNGEAGILPPGHGYLADFLLWARGERLPYAYLGTTYGNGSRYKSRGINAVEFWDGSGWNSDRTELGRLRQADDTPACNT